MLEIFSTVIMGGVVGYSFLKKTGLSNDADKINKIAKNCGLLVKEKNGEKTEIKTIHLYRRKQHSWGTEYIYRIPLGKSFKDFQDKLEHFQDGLNNKAMIYDVKKTIQQKKLVKVKTNKRVQMSYDGMLHIKVYDEALNDELLYTDELREQCKGWQVIIGQSQEKLVKHDFEDTPHFIIGGATRFGKSVFLKNLITTLLLNQSENVEFTLIDLKGGLTFNRFRNAPQVKYMAYNLSQTVTALSSISSEMVKRQEEFLGKGFEDIREANFKKRHFIIIDEAGELDDVCKEYASEIARIGGGLGYRIVFASQYTTGDVLPRQVKQNADNKLCFRLQNKYASSVVLGEENGDAAELPLIKGRAVFVTGAEKHIVQTPYITNEYIQDRIPRGEKVERRTERRTDFTFIEEA